MGIVSTKIKRLIGVGYTLGNMKIHQTKAYNSGEALKGHQMACHGGVFDTSCNACNELLLKSGLTAMPQDDKVN